MKIPKLDDRNPQDIKVLVDKINEILSYLTCEKCGQITTIKVKGLCFVCTEGTFGYKPKESQA